MEFTDKNPTYPQTHTTQNERQRERQGNIMDASEQEFAQAKEILSHSANKHKKVELNEAGRTTESDEKGNPPEATRGRIPEPSKRETGH